MYVVVKLYNDNITKGLIQKTAMNVQSIYSEYVSWFTKNLATTSFKIDLLIAALPYQIVEIIQYTIKRYNNEVLAV